MHSAAPSIFSLPPEEKRKAYDEALERCDAEQRRASAEYKARKAAPPDPRADNYLTWKDQRKVCVLVVKHQPKPASIECSRDGSYYPPIYLANSESEPQPESTSDFVLTIVPKWLAKKTDLAGIVLPLSRARPWTDEQAATWARLDRIRDSINRRIQTARAPQIKGRELTLTRNGAA